MNIHNNIIRNNNLSIEINIIIKNNDILFSMIIKSENIILKAYSLSLGI